jgi:hypothetical protein
MMSAFLSSMRKRESRVGEKMRSGGRGGINAPEDGQQDVDEQVGAAPGDEEDAHGRDCGVLVLVRGVLRGGTERGRRTEEGDDDEEDCLEHGCGGNGW